MRVNRRDNAILAARDYVLEDLLFGFVEKDGDQGRTVDDNHREFRSSMISRGSRGSSIGMAAISATIRSTLAFRAAMAAGD